MLADESDERRRVLACVLACLVYLFGDSSRIAGKGQ